MSSEAESLLPSDVRQRMNVTLLEGQSFAMMEARLQGRSISQIAIQFGVEPSLVEDMIQRALREGIGTRRHQEFQVGLLSRLMELGEELNTLNRRLRSKSKLRHTEFPKGAGKPETLWEEVSNVSEKRKLIAEQRQTLVAIKSVLASDPGEIPSAEREGQIAEIMGAMKEVSQEVTREMSARIASEAREAGRLEERAKGGSGPVINLPPGEKK